ncbi:MAG TPA: ankyrin repeat domain-containing protein [bacterium]|nr:ankyrin repeat domain-containing protein [bacterium]
MLRTVILVLLSLLALPLHAGTHDYKLLNAAKAGDIMQVKTLLETGDVDVNVIDSFQTSPLMMAVDNKHLAVAEFLLQHGADIHLDNKYGYTPLMQAVMRNDPKMVNMLLDKGAKIDQKNFYTELTPLMMAVDNGSMDMVELLIARKANLNLQDERGRSALMHATAARQAKIAQRLTQAGADATLKDKQGRTADDLAKTSQP